MKTTVEELGQLYKSLATREFVEVTAIDRGIQVVRNFAMDPDPELLGPGAHLKQISHFAKTTANLWFDLEKKIEYTDKKSERITLASQAFYTAQALKIALRLINDATLLRRYHEIQPHLAALVRNVGVGEVGETSVIAQVDAFMAQVFVTNQNPWEACTVNTPGNIQPGFVLQTRVEALRAYRARLINDLEASATVIALDFDGTISTDVEHWKKFVKAARKRGHKVYIVTMRYPSELHERRSNGMTIHEEWSMLVDGILPTSRMAKRKYCTRLKIVPDIWIDDRPMAIYQDANVVFGDSSPTGLCVNELPEGPRLEVRGVKLDDNEEAVDILLNFADENGYTRQEFIRYVFDLRLKKRYEERLALYASAEA